MNLSEFLKDKKIIELNSFEVANLIELHNLSDFVSFFEKIKPEYIYKIDDSEDDACLNEDIEEDEDNEDDNVVKILKSIYKNDYDSWRINKIINPLPNIPREQLLTKVWYSDFEKNRALTPLIAPISKEKIIKLSEEFKTKLKNIIDNVRLPEENPNKLPEKREIFTYLFRDSLNNYYSYIDDNYEKEKPSEKITIKADIPDIFDYSWKISELIKNSDKEIKDYYKNINKQEATAKLKDIVYCEEFMSLSLKSHRKKWFMENNEDIVLGYYPYTLDILEDLYKQYHKDFDNKGDKK